MPEKAVFLDKDGTLISNVPYNVDPGKIVLETGAGEALRKVASHHFKLIVVSNQSGVARGFFTEGDLQPVFSRINEMLASYNVHIDGFYYCPHHPEGNLNEYSIHCDCRKPEVGLIQKAAKDLDIDLAGSWMVGDILNDVEAGKRAGCRTVLIDNGNETEWILDDQYRHPDFTVSSLEEMAAIIVSNSTAEV